MPVHGSAGRDVRPLDRDALRLVDGHGVAMGDVAVAREFDHNALAFVEPNDKAASAEGFERAQGAVADPEPLVVLGEEQSFSDREVEAVRRRTFSDNLFNSAHRPTFPERRSIGLSGSALERNEGDARLGYRQSAIAMLSRGRWFGVVNCLIRQEH